MTLLQVKFLCAVLQGVLPKDRRRAAGAKSVGAAAAEQEGKEGKEGKEEFFEGLGNIAEAPKYLRIKGKVECKALARRAEVEGVTRCAGAQPQHSEAGDRGADQRHVEEQARARQEERGKGKAAGGHPRLHLPVRRSALPCVQRRRVTCSRYLQQKHGNFQNVICEVAYNLMDGLKRCAVQQAAAGGTPTRAQVQGGR